MKRIFRNTVVMLLFIFCLILPSCEQHMHTGEEGWTSDETGHWHSATCEHTEEKIEYAAHSWGTSQYLGETEEVRNVCVVCGYVRILPHEHTYGNWEYDMSEHWKKTTCRIHSSYSAQRGLHDWDVSYTETNTGQPVTMLKCKVCGLRDVQDHAHKWKKTCDLEKMEETWVCSECNKTETHTHVHDLSETWQITDRTHWQMTECGLHDPVRQSEGFHNIPWGTMSGKIITGVCIICSQTGQVPHETCSYRTASNGIEHYKQSVCKNHEKISLNPEPCTRILKYENCAHWYETTCTNHDPTNSSYESCSLSGWYSDETHHWRMTTCSVHDPYEYRRGEHVFKDSGNGTMTCECGAVSP